MKHIGVIKNGDRRYLCNQACNITEDKICRECEVITCKNCLNIIEKNGNSKKEMIKNCKIDDFYYGAD